MANAYEWAACIGKKPYETWTRASQIAKRRKRQGRRGVVYHCRSCQKFHIGRPSPKGVE